VQDGGICEQTTKIAFAVSSTMNK